MIHSSEYENQIHYTNCNLKFTQEKIQVNETRKIIAENDVNYNF